MRNLVRACFVLLALAAAACGPEEGTDKAPEPTVEVGPEAPSSSTTVLRGFLELGPEVRRLTVCGEEDPLWVIPIDGVTQAYDELARDPYDPVFVEVDATLGPAPETGFGADHAGLATLRALRRAEAASEGFGCEEDLSSFVFRAAGQEPFWHLRVTPAAVILSTPDVPETVFDPAAPVFRDGGWDYATSASGPETLTLQLEVRPGRCRDSMSGAWFSWDATLRVGDEVRVGCAWEGGLAPRQ